MGIFGRESGQARLTVQHTTRTEELQAQVEAHTRPGCTVNTDEWVGYGKIVESQRTHQTVCHTPGKQVWARDLDGDGIREVHVNTAEGFWTGLRNFLRPFRGVNRIYLGPYVAIHEWAYRYCETLKGHRNAKDQLMRASQAIPLNIAEGNGKGTDGDRRRYFEIARGSALECGAVQDVLQVCGAMTADENAKAKVLLDRIVAMLTKLGQRGYAVHEKADE